MARGGAGNMLGVGGTRQHLGRKALRGGGRGGRIGGGGVDPRAQKRELLRTLQEKRREGDGGKGTSPGQASTRGGQGSPQSVSRAAR
ncbi:DUF6243 family protein [Streptomyces sp. NPDC020731]|uniref:DUF6243 family protein n=1 Tax=Streptomyces sp. NPDC020731 TaxID=3365085 RepID=UPI0037B14E70